MRDFTSFRKDRTHAPLFGAAPPTTSFRTFGHTTSCRRLRLTPQPGERLLRHLRAPPTIRAANPNASHKKLPLLLPQRCAIDLGQRAVSEPSLTWAGHSSFPSNPPRFPPPSHKQCKFTNKFPKYPDRLRTTSPALLARLFAKTSKAKRREAVRLVKRSASFVSTTPSDTELPQSFRQNGSRCKSLKPFTGTVAFHKRIRSTSAFRNICPRCTRAARRCSSSAARFCKTSARRCFLSNIEFTFAMHLASPCSRIAAIAESEA